MVMRPLLQLAMPMLFAMLACMGCAGAKLGSIGAHLSRDNETGALYVRDLSPGLAGEKAGLLPGDEIIMIDGHYVRQIDAPRIREMLRGQVGTAVRLTVVRGELVVRMKVARSELRDVPDEQPKPRMETLKER
jgi:C-terminal processing protease CtpA/Prc